MRQIQAQPAPMLAESASQPGSSLNRISERGALLAALDAQLRALASRYQLYWGANEDFIAQFEHQPRLRPPSAMARAALAVGQTTEEYGLLYVPLLALGELRGWIALDTPQATAAVSALAAQAAPWLALFDQQAAPHDSRELAIMDQIGRMLSSTLELDDLLPRLGAIVRELIPADTFYIALLDTSTDELYFAYLYDHAVGELPTARWPSTAGLTGQIIHTGVPILTDDYLSECARRGIQPQRPSQLRYSRAWLGVPLRHQDQPLGVMVACMDDPAARYTRDDLHLLSTVAAQAAAAVANAQLYRRIEQQASQLASINRIFRAISATLDPHEVPLLIISELCQALDVEDGLLLLTTTGSNELVVQAALEPKTGLRLSAERGLPAEALRRGQVIFDNQPAPSDELALLDRHSRQPTRSLICAPLAGRQQLRGVILLRNKRRGAFMPADARLLEAVAEQAAIALENAELYANADSALAAHLADLEQRNRQLTNILAISDALRATNTLKEVGQQIVAIVQKITGSQRIAVGLVEPDYQDVSLVAQVGLPHTRRLRREDNTPLVQVEAMLRSAERIGAITYHVRQHPLTAAYFRDALVLTLLNAAGSPVALVGLDLAGASAPLSAAMVQELEIIAHQAALAIISAYRASQQQQMLDRLTALNGLTLAITTTPLSSDEILNMTLRGAMGTTNGIAGGWQLHGRDGDIRQHAVGLSDEAAQALWPVLARSELDYVELHTTQLPEALTAQGMHSLLIVPVRGARLKLGALWIGYREAIVPTTEREMVVLYAKSAGGVLENLRLFDQVSSAHERLASILASTTEGMLLISDGGLITTANSSLLRLLGLPGLTLDGQPVATLAALLAERSEPEALHRVCAALEAVASGTATNCQGELHLHAPETRALAWSALPVQRTGGQPGRGAALLVLRDITAERQADQLRQDLANMIVHDLRAPLTNMMVSTDLLLKQSSGPLTEAQQRILQIAADSSQQMLDLVNALLDIRRLEQRQLELQRRPTEIFELVESVLERLSRLAAARQVRCINATAPLPPASIDVELIRRVLQNLVDNAIKFSPRGGTIRISGALLSAEQLPREHPPGRYLLIDVSDEGRGVPEAYRTLIFELFGQAPHSQGQGTGVGLAFCRLAVQAHGGQIWVETAAGGGALFRFTLPAELTAP
ncbi:GAF domain-containing protein [Kallotenue papyrolyticum]|uniref:GAF domain-containing protein n=1 Tax=Kallotenue papyrolyticum TaxID=1325125 RepID=UPI0004719105|nr:GAF domain-containing protein [Kallotenue papyrolyticum]